MDSSWNTVVVYLSWLAMSTLIPEVKLISSTSNARSGISYMVAVQKHMVPVGLTTVCSLAPHGVHVLRYMAPEVFRHEPYNLKVDVYSFAMIIFQLFECTVPFAGVDPVEAARNAAMLNVRPGFPPRTKLSSTEQVSSYSPVFH